MSAQGINLVRSFLKSVRFLILFRAYAEFFSEILKEVRVYFISAFKTYIGYRNRTVGSEGVGGIVQSHIIYIENNGSYSCFSKYAFISRSFNSSLPFLHSNEAPLIRSL